MCTLCTLSSLHSLCAYALFFSSLSDVSSRYRTISGGSVESGPLTCTQTPAISLPTLTEYIQQLRAYLPNANLIGLQVCIHTMKWRCHMHALCFCVHVSLAVLSGLVHGYLENYKTYMYMYNNVLPLVSLFPPKETSGGRGGRWENGSGLPCHSSSQSPCQPSTGQRTHHLMESDGH